MHEALQKAVDLHGKPGWRVSIAYSASGCRVYVNLGDGFVFRGRARRLADAEAVAAAKIREWVNLRTTNPTDGDALVPALEASIDRARRHRVKAMLRLIRGGRS